jgi:Acyl-CoA synthetase (NDP forming)
MSKTNAKVAAGKAARLLEYDKAASLMKRFGISIPRAEYINSKEGAERFAQDKRIALKVISDKALHKSQSGVIKLGLDSKSAGAAYLSLHAKAVNEKLSPFKILAQEMSEPGTEIIIGTNTDKQFGKLILLGLGGIYVEVFKDVSVRACPINDYDAESMLSELKSKSVIAPDSASEKRVISLLKKVSDMVVSNEWVMELDLNPVIMHKTGYSAVDVRIMV